MIKKTIVILLSCLVVACGVTPDNPSSNFTADKAMHRSQKRGVAFGFSRLDDSMLLSPAISWFYNWGPDVGAIEVDTWFGLDSVVFFPMAWNGGFDSARISNYVTSHPASKYLLAFNEPNLNDQAHMTPSEAAEKWPRLKALADQLNLKIVSPAMNYGTLEGYHDPIKWLDEFFSLVPLSDVDVIALHCYMTSVSGLENYIDMFDKYGKPIWLTEFCAWDPVPGSVDAQLSYMCQALNMLEQKQSIERYAWFIPRTSSAVDKAPFMQLLTHNRPSELTEAGCIFTSFSSFDRSVWLDASKPVSANCYVALSNNIIQIRLCPDTNAMMIKNLSENQWVEYQMFVPDDASKLQLCFASPVSCTMAVYVDNELLTFADMERSGSDMSEWKICSIPITALPGRHTFRLLLGKGSLNLKWIKIE